MATLKKFCVFAKSDNMKTVLRKTEDDRILETHQTYLFVVSQKAMVSEMNRSFKELLKDVRPRHFSSGN
jgi:hypothetical protein